MDRRGNPRNCGSSDTDRASFLGVSLNVYAWSVHVAPMMVTVTLVHIEARSTRHALAFTEAVVTNLAAHAIRLGGAC